VHIHHDDLTSLAKLKTWFLSQQRDLPWRNHPIPYAVWISEVMLQQTQVAVVIPYFERWMRRFPSILDLAGASIEEVLKEWEGLGYYARARNLHAGARYVVDHYQGELPSSAEKLKKIKGLGPYTIGAILNFAFHQRIPAVDGNVLRVLARYYGIADDICKPKAIKQIYSLTETLLPEKEPWVISEALIELGATICGRQPKCVQCPLNKQCQAHLKGLTDVLPFKAPRMPTTVLHRSVAIIHNGKEILISRGVKGKVMQDLYEFPYFEKTTTASLHEQIKERFEIDVQQQQVLPEVKHSFTRYRAHLFPCLFKTDTRKNIEGHEWASFQLLEQYPFSSGHRRIVNSLKFNLYGALKEPH